METVCAGLQSGVDNAPGTSPILHVVISCLQLEFLNRINGRLHRLGALILKISGERVIVGAIDHEIVLSRAVAINAEDTLRTLLKRSTRRIHAGRKQCKLVVTAAIKR